MSAIEIRKTEDGSLDEIVAEGCYFHLEYMGDGRWWFCVTKGEERADVWFSTTKKHPMCVDIGGGDPVEVPKR